MDLLLPGQLPRLDSWQHRPFSAGSDAPDGSSRHAEHVAVVGHEPPGPPLVDGLHRRVADAVLRFRVFPPSIGMPVLAREPVEVGDAVGLRFRAPGGASLFFASRVTERFDHEDSGWWRTGFTYRTLAGHPEIGQETFSVEKDLSTGLVRAALRSFSRQGLWITRAGAPVARWVQRRAAGAALEHLRGVAQGRGA